MADHPLILLTGTSAAGKTTVGRLLADALPTSAFVEGDAVRTMVRGGRADMTPEPTPEALRQLALRYRQTALLAGSSQEAGFATVVEDIIVGRHRRMLAELRTERLLRRLRPDDLPVVVQIQGDPAANRPNPIGAASPARIAQH